MTLKRLQHAIPILLYLWYSSYPSRYTVVKLLPYYAHRRCEYKGTGVGLKGSVFDSWPIIEYEPLHVADET